MDEINGLKKALERKQSVVVHAFYLIAYIIRRMDKKFKQIYYSDDGYWRGKIAIQRLAKASGSTKEEAERWLLKQPLCQIHLPAPKYVPRPNASMSLFAKPNDIHQNDLLSLPHDKFKKKTYKYALNIVDVASRYKGSYQEKLLDVGTKVRYLYEPGELEGYQYKGERRKRSTDPIWSVDLYKIKDRYVQKHQPTLYYRDAGPKRSFVFEELQPIHDP